MMIEIGTFGSRLRRAREIMGLNQDEMAARIGVSLRSYSRYENEGRELPLGALTRAAEMGVSVTWLLTGTGEPFTGEAAKSSSEAVKRLDAIEAELDKANVPVSVGSLGKGSVLLDMYRQLVAIAGDPGVDGNLRARADMMLDLGFGDAGSAARRERRMERGMEEMRHSLKSATDAYTSLLLDLQWEPPGLVGMAVRDAMMVDGLSDEMARFILAAVKEEMTKSEKRRGEA